MAWTKIKTTVVVGVGVLFAAGTVTVCIEHLAQFQRKNEERKIMNQTSPQTEAAIAKIEAKLRAVYNPLPRILIAPTKFPGKDMAEASSGNHLLGWNRPIKRIVDMAFPQLDNFHLRMIIETNLPQGNFDFNADSKDYAVGTLQQVLEKTLGIVGTYKMIEADVLHIKLVKPNASGLKRYNPSTVPMTPYKLPPGQIILFCQTLAVPSYRYESAFQNLLENYFRKPIIFDQAGLTNRFDINMTWDEPDPKHHNVDGLKQALYAQLGLELVTNREPVEMLVVEKVK